MNFKDYFSKQAQDYAIYRPHYPEIIFDYLNNLGENHQTAWDCATGNGQVALGLTPYFHKIYASDASENQIKNAIKHEKIEYFVSLAESTNLTEKSIDLITVAQAFHWFNAERFYAEVNRVLKPNGILAIWCYGFFEIAKSYKTLQLALQQFYDEIDPYWPAERKLIDSKYQTIRFPYPEIKTPQFLMTKRWTVEQLLGYLYTWSSSQKYITAKGEEEIKVKMEVIANHWPSTEQKIEINWPIHSRIGVLSNRG